MRNKSSSHRNRRNSGDGRAADAPPKNDLSIVAIGASAGGIEAFTELMSELPADTGMSFVLIQHLDPKHHSILTELFSKKTPMRVKEVTNGMRVERDHIYIIPPNAVMSISNHTLNLSPRGESRSLHMPIDHFMRALAEELGNRAIGVILSGSGTDGTLGLAEIQAHGGLAFAQDESSARYNAMPGSAIAAGRVDYVLSPKGIARELTRIARHPYVARDYSTEALSASAPESARLSAIFQALRLATGVDFTHYRQTTILRRIQRRMVLHKIDKLAEYVRYVQTNPSELKALYHDLLINVTSFFRNPSVFDALKQKVFPSIQRARFPDGGIRVWTPGCATGEETYSVAIALLEFLGDKASRLPLQFFGTDVSESSINKARTGFYPENIQGDVSPERLRRFFNKIEGGYRISRSVRDMCIFAQHNLLNDPPFSQMDLICCRNLLIYLEPILQSKVISLFHYSARAGGFLVLGASEGVGTTAGLFAIEDRTHKIFSKIAAVPKPVNFSLAPVSGRKGWGTAHTPAAVPDPTWNYMEAQKEFDRRLLTQYAPATVFVNEEMEIIHTRGDVNRYLKLSSGRPSLSLLKMAREGLLLELRSAISRAKKENVPVKKRNLLIRNGDGKGRASQAEDPGRVVDVEVVPFTLGTLKEFYFMIVFHEPLQDLAEKTPARLRRLQVEEPLKTKPAKVAKLEQELAATKEYLQSVIETQEATNEELQSANEEILSSNEELQSTNEELETAKEELQSANEELNTVNDELRVRNSEMTLLNSDLTNLLSSIDIAVIMVGSDLTIRRFTPKAQKFLGLIPTDIGRPLFQINPTVPIRDLQSMVLQVMKDFHPVEQELTDSNGHYQLRVLAYRTPDNRVDGAVITIVDIAPEEKTVAAN